MKPDKKDAKEHQEKPKKMSDLNSKPSDKGAEQVRGGAREELPKESGPTGLK
jgi:hypothetical protein